VKRHKLERLRRYLENTAVLISLKEILRPIRFPADLDRLETVGPPVPVLSQVVTTEDGAADFDISEDGTLAYVTGGVQSVARSLVWVDRQGREEPLKAPARGFTVHLAKRAPFCAVNGVCTSVCDCCGLSNASIFRLRRSSDVASENISHLLSRVTE
jgi:hypothetical protein